MGAVLHLVFSIVLLPVRLIRTVFKIGTAAACLVSLLPLLIVAGVIVLIIHLTHP
jgi:hypothetical protein